MKNIDPQLTDAVSTAYQKWFAQFPEIETLPTKDWRPVHVIAYWVKLYKNHYGVDYTFKFNHTAPSKSWEIQNIKKISQQLSSDPQILKDYLDWFFQTIIVAKQKRITSIAILANPIDVNKYKFLKLIPNANIDRSTPLPPNYMTIIKSFNAPINNYGELAFIRESEEYRGLMDALVGAGMDLKILDRVK